VSLNPLEVMFVKVKGYLLELDWTTATFADAIDRWMHHKARPATHGTTSDFGICARACRWRRAVEPVIPANASPRCDV